LEVKDGYPEKHNSSVQQKKKAQKWLFGSYVLQERKENNSQEKEERKEGAGTQLKKLAIYLIKLWQRFISPLYPPSCRYYPTCSNYAIMAIEKYGLFKGSLKAFLRILRCNPFFKGGVDYP